jgi:SulP family sulfate permease
MSTISKALPDFRFSLAEFSGSLADLGVMLPLALALISLNGMDATAVFVGVGLAYIITALVYRLPIPVQPLKSVSAVALALNLAPVVIVTGAIWNAVAFLGLGTARLDRWVKAAFPKAVVRGIQLGLAYLLITSAWKLINTRPDWPGNFTALGPALGWNAVLAVGALIVLVILLKTRPGWAALSVLVFGIAIAVWQVGRPAMPLQIHLPTLLPLVPTWDQLWQGLVLLALPQIPLSLGNSIYATADAAQQYFGERAGRVTERRLMLTMGFNDLLTAAIGGIPVCHGCGGLTAHYRLGARTGGAPLMIGSLFLIIGLLGGPAVAGVIRLVPFAVLGILLAYVAVQHALLARDLRGWREWLTALLVLALSVYTGNLAIGFISAAVVYHGWGRVRPRFDAERTS